VSAGDAWGVAPGPLTTFRSPSPSSASHPVSTCLGLVLGAALLLLARPAAADWALYVSSFNNNKIVKFNSSGVATVFATNGVNGVLKQPNGLVFDALGNLYVANSQNNTIERYDPQGNGSLFASLSGTDNVGVPNGLAFDGLNRLFEANGGDRILQITNELGQAKVFAVGLTELNAVSGIAFDNAGNLWAANLNGWIERFDPQGNGTKVYTNNLSGVRALVFDTAGNLYASAANTVLKFDPQGNRTTYATINLGGTDNAYGMAFDSAGNLFVASPGASAVAKVSPQGVVTTFATSSSGLFRATFLAIREDGRYSTDWHKAAGGGGASTNAEFLITGTAGQHDAGTMASGTDSLTGGFWSLYAIATPGAPLLSITLAITLTTTNTAMVSWPSPSTGWNLQQNNDLSTANWVTPAETVNDNGTIKYIIVSPPTGNRFYRLMR
jgi:sugar lactone lactonase YvrE